MDTRVFSAYNESSKKQLASGIGVVDSVDEPIKVLKILMEGLTPASRSGIWITRFHGLPIARSYAPFDLIYLDENHRVVHDVEITQTSSFVPFKGLPTSALILPPRSIASSKTFTGDRIAIHTSETAQPSSEQAKAVRPAAPPPSAAPPAANRRLNITLEVVEEVPAPLTPAPQGVLRPAKRNQNPPPDLQPSVPPLAPEYSNIPKPPGEREEVLRQPKKRRTTPAAAPVSPPAPAIEPDPQPVASPSVASDSTLSAPIPPDAPIPDALIPDASIPDTPDPATLQSPKLPPGPEAPDFAEAASAEPISAEPASSPPPIPGPVFFDPALETAVAVVPETSSYAAPIPEAPAPIERSNAPVETSQSESATPPALAPAQLSSLHAHTLHPEPGGEAASVTPEEPLPVDLSPGPGAPAPNQAQPQLASSNSPESEPRPESPKALDKPQQQKAMDIARRWDVKLLYSLFPELHPSYRPELTMPSVDPIKYLKSEHDEDDKLPAKLQVLSWLYPELELETLEKRQRSQRRAPRIENPGLVGYFYSSGKAEPHEIRNFSVTGFYMKTDERWLPGTVIRITLQMVDTDGSNPGDSLTLHSRVVNWDDNGGGFEFVLPGFLE